MSEPEYIYVKGQGWVPHQGSYLTPTDRRNYPGFELRMYWQMSDSRGVCRTCGCWAGAHYPNSVIGERVIVEVYPRCPAISVFGKPSGGAWVGPVETAPRWS